MYTGAPPPNCDRLDGVQDGVLEDPTRCKFDPKVLECKAADGPSLERALSCPTHTTFTLRNRSTLRKNCSNQVKADISARAMPSYQHRPCL